MDIRKTDIRVEFDSANVQEPQIGSDKGVFTVRNQIGCLRQPAKRSPLEIVVSLSEGQAEFDVGTYRILEESVSIDRYRRLTF